MIGQTVTIIRKNFSHLLGAETLLRLMMLVLTIFIARIYGTEKFGIYALALSVGNLFEIIFNLGLGTVFIQRVAGGGYELAHQLSVFLPLKIILSALSFVCFVLFALALGKNTETFLCLLFAGLYFSLFSFETFLWACFDSKQKMYFTAYIKLFKFTVVFCLGMYFVFQKAPVYYLMYAYLAAVIAAIIVTVYLIARYFTKFKIKIDISAWKQIIAEGWPITLSSAFVFIYNSLDTIIISILKGEREVGLYQVSYKIIGTIFLISTLINQAYLPALVKTFSAKYVASRETVDIFSRSLRSVFFWSIPITFGAMMLADRIILFVFGPEYMAGVNAFRILIWNCIIYFLSSAMTNLIYAGRKQKKAMVIFFLGAAANTIFNIFMIPMFGIEGAALTTVLAEIVVLAGIYILARKIAPIKIFGNLLTPLLAGIVMAGSLFFIKAESLIITIAIGSVVYFGTYFLLLKFSQSWGGEQILAAAETGNESLPKESP